MHLDSYPFIHLSIYLSTYLYTYLLSMYLCIYLVCMCVPVHTCIYINQVPVYFLFPSALIAVLVFQAPGPEPYCTRSCVKSPHPNRQTQCPQPCKKILQPEKLMQPPNGASHSRTSASTRRPSAFCPHAQATQNEAKPGARALNAFGLTLRMLRCTSSGFTVLDFQQILGCGMFG